MGSFKEIRNLFTSQDSRASFSNTVSANSNSTELSRGLNLTESSLRCSSLAPEIIFGTQFTVLTLFEDFSLCRKSKEVSVLKTQLTASFKMEWLTYLKQYIRIHVQYDDCGILALNIKLDILNRIEKYGMSDNQKLATSWELTL